MLMLSIYLFIACSYFSFLILLIVRDRESSLKDSIHLKVAIIASIFWPVVIPVSLLELKLKSKVKPDANNAKKLSKHTDGFGKAKNVFAIRGIEFGGKENYLLKSEVNNFSDTSN